MVLLENCALLGFSQRKLVIPCRRFGTIGSILKVGPIGFPEKSVRNYHYKLRNNLEARRSHLLRGGNLKSSMALLIIISMYV
jgi:hypothetical protein